jgi:hypothetical protein
MLFCHALCVNACRDLPTFTLDVKIYLPNMIILVGLQQFSWDLFLLPLHVVYLFGPQTI